MENKKILVTKASLPKKEEFFELCSSIFDSAWLTNMGALHNRLENELKTVLDTNNISLFVNGHLALELLIQAMELKKEIITTPFSFASTTHAIVRNGIRPVFCDIKEDDFTIDENKLEALITEDTTAILAVHVYGNICNHEKLSKIAKKHGIKLIYDAAHAFLEKYHGNSVANLAYASMFSFHATKVFNTIEGGAISSADQELHKKLYFLKNFGIADKENTLYVGSNAKMNEFQAAMGLCNLKYINIWIEKRKQIAYRYLKNLKNQKGIRCNNYKTEQSYNYSYFPIVVDKETYGMSRDDLYNKLAENNIYARKYFYPCINELECYKSHNYRGETKMALDISKNILTLPIYPDLSLEIVDKICELIKN